jgi:hypothetical protein
MSLTLYRYILYISLFIAVIIGTTVTMQYSSPAYCMPIFESCYSITYYAEFKPSNLIVQPLYMITTFASFIIWHGLVLHHKNSPNNKFLTFIVYFKTINMITAFLTFHNTGYKFFEYLHFACSVFMFFAIIYLQVYVSFSKHYGQSTPWERYLSWLFLFLPVVAIVLNYLFDTHIRLFLEWVYVFQIGAWYMVSTKRWNIKFTTVSTQ